MPIISLLKNRKERSFSEKAEKYGLIKGTYIKITKVKVKNKLSYDVGLGDSISGLISYWLEFGHPIHFSPNGQTSGVIKIFKKKEKIYIETENSVYEVIFF
ncbi:MAG: hypothetical protein ABH951_01115 [Patescibacteria group bacterium]